MSKRFSNSAQWIWDNRVNELGYLPWVLTAGNQDPSVPNPRLSDSEAKSLFLSLEELKLVFPFNTKDGTAYQVNHIKEHEWKAAIRELRKAGWRRSKKFQAAKRFAVWAMSLIVASFLGALFAEASKDFYKNQVQPRVFKTNHVEKTERKQ